MQQFQSLADPAHSSNAVSHVPRSLYTCKQALVHHDAMNCLNKTCSHGCRHLPHNHINYCQRKVYNCTLLTPPEPTSTSSLATKPIELRGFLGFASQIAANIDVHQDVRYREKDNRHQLQVQLFTENKTTSHSSTISTNAQKYYNRVRQLSSQVKLLY